MLAACGVAGCGGAPEERAAALAISDVTVIDAVSGVRAGQTVWIDGDRIVAVEPSGSVRPEALEVIDGAGRYLIPGLWDMHVHLTYDERLIDFMPAAFIRYGITSVRDTGGLMRKLAPLVERMRAEGAIAPRVFFSGPLLDGEPVVYDGLGAAELGVANGTPEIAAANVARLKSQGVDFIKIYEMVSPDVFEALAEAARSHSLPIAAHVPLSMRASAAGPRVDSMEHLRNIALDCVEDPQALLDARLEYLREGRERPGMELRGDLHRMQRMDAIEVLDRERCGAVLKALRNTIQVPTARLNALSLFPVFEREDWDDALAEMPPALAEEWRRPPPWINADPALRDHRFARYTLDMIGRMQEAGVPIGAGTDTPLAHAIPGYSLHNELEILVASGLTPLQALEAATVQPAAFFGLQGEMGAIAPGMRADLVLLHGDPLADIGNTRSIDRVIARGRLMPRQWDPSRYSQEVTLCDHLASHSDDPFAVAPGVSQGGMDIAGAIAACEAAVAADPENPRLRYQLARTYGYSGQGEKAYPHREAAIAADYPQALFVNGYLHFLGINKAPKDICRAGELMRRAAQYGRLAGQIGFSRYALDGEFDGCDVPVDPLEIAGFLDAAAASANDYYLDMLIAMLRKKAQEAQAQHESG